MSLIPGWPDCFDLCGISAEKQSSSLTSSCWFLSLLFKSRASLPSRVTYLLLCVSSKYFAISKLPITIFYLQLMNEYLLLSWCKWPFVWFVLHFSLRLALQEFLQPHIAWDCWRLQVLRSILKSIKISLLKFIFQIWKISLLIYSNLFLFLEICCALLFQFWIV